jgi:acetoin utilization protein AcuB
VVEDGALVGMVSDRDLARYGFTLAAEGAGRHVATIVGEVMSPDVVAIEPETEVDEIIDLLLEHKVGALPVVDRATDTVVGIVSYIDVLRALRDRLEQG